MGAVKYEEIYMRSIEKPEEFWRDQAHRVHWFQEGKRVLDATRSPFFRWFPGWQTNLCYNAVDRHVKAGKGQNLAVIWESPEIGQTRTLSFAELHREVNTFAAVLQKLGVRKGDTVLIYMPMVPEAIVAMLGCVRIGAVHAVVFAGFSVEALAHRIEDSGAKVVVCADGTIRKGKPIALKDVLDRALAQRPTAVKHVILLDRGLVPCSRVPHRDLLWTEAMSNVGEVYVQPEPLDSTHPSYILYTSGTTGKPKGVVRDTGGYMVALHTSLDFIYGASSRDIFWATSDIGWVVGHSYIVYGPLLYGIPTLLYEGTPDTPHPGIWWEIIQKHGVTILFSSPTALRMLRKYPDEWIKRYDLGRLRFVFLAGEPLDEPTYRWAMNVLEKPVVDHYWQTESGWPMIANHMGLSPLPFKPGSPTKAAIGWRLDVVDMRGDPVGPGERGILVAYPPLPPGALLTLWRDDLGYVQNYWGIFQSYGKLLYMTGDYAIRDEDGYFRLLGRADEVINVAGHRLGTREVEEVLSAHPAVAEVSAIGIEDEVKGQALAVFVVIKKDIQDSEALRQDLIKLVRESIGPIATPKVLQVVPRLPKTRSGKVMRRVLRAICEGKDLGDLSTVEDEATVEEVRQALDELRYQG